MVELPCDFGLVRSDDLIEQIVGWKGTTMQGGQDCMRNVFWKSDFELDAGELEIAVHRGLST